MSNTPHIPLVSDLTHDELKGKRVLVRVGFDVPVKNGVVENDFRIREALPTLKYLIGAGARVVLISHIGRDKENSLAPVADALRAYVPVTFVPDLVGDVAREAVAHAKEGECLLLENLRGNEGESKNDVGFAEALAAHGELFVFESFSVAHREHASIVGIPKFLPSYLGLECAREVSELSHARAPENPSLFILGGAKFDTKMPLIETFLAKYAMVFVGGALAHDIWIAQGISVGTSVKSDINLKGSPIITHSALRVPVDVVVKNAAGETRVTVPTDVHADEAIMDCGPETVKMIAAIAKDSKTVLWNGPLGLYEGGFVDGTRGVAEGIASGTAFSVVGGGDTVAAIESLNVRGKIGFISTGGGAMLEFLLAGTLPGIDALVKK